VIALADAGAASPGESLTRLYLLDAGLGPVRTQVAFVGGRYVVDLLVRGKLIIEFEGRRHDEADHFVADRRRFNALSQLPGMAVLRLTWADLRDPAALVAQVRAALRQLGEDV
jgi:very-short-patch-repair endonuclease